MDYVNRLHYDIEVMTRRLELEKRRLQRLDKELAVAKRTRHQKIQQVALAKNPRRAHAVSVSRPTAKPPPRLSVATKALDKSFTHQREGGCVADLEGEKISETTMPYKTIGTLDSVGGDENCDAGPPMRVLLNRLDNSRKKANVLKYECEELRTEINHLRRTRLQCDGIFQKLRTEIKTRASQLADFVEETAASQAVFGDVKQRIAVMKEQREGERTQFKNDVMRLREQLKFHEWEKKEVEVQLKRAETGVQRKRDLIVPHEETQFSEPAMMRRIMKTAFLNCIQRRHIKQHQKNIEVFEQAFATIKQSTGIEHIEEIVKIFVNLESRNYSLLTYVNHMNRDIEALECAKHARKNLEIERQRATEQQQQFRDHALSDVKKQLASAETLITRDREASSQHKEILNSVQPVLLQIVERIEQETKRLRNAAPGNQPANASAEAQLQRPAFELRIDSIPEWLKWVEHALGKFRELIPAADTDQAFPSTAALLVKQLPPKRLGGHAPPPPLVKALDLPSASGVVGVLDEMGQGAAMQRAGAHGAKGKQSDVMDEESDEEEDFEGGPLDQHKLRDLAKSAQSRREKRQARRLGERGGKDKVGKKITDGSTTGPDSHPRGVLRNSEATHLANSPESLRPDSADSAVGKPSRATDAESGDGLSEKDVDEEVAAAAAGAEAVRDAQGSMGAYDALVKTQPSKHGKRQSTGERQEAGARVTIEYEKWNDTREISDAELNMNFLKRYKMSKTELQVIADRMGLHLSHLCNLKYEFDNYDEDKSGYIDIRELRSLLHKLGEDVSEDELEEACRELDADHSGEIEFFEFVEWFHKPS